jgi:hypothetical protein
MNGLVTSSPRSPDFQRAFVALRYFWGARGNQLSDGFGKLPLCHATADLLQQLSVEERSERARALGAELGRLAAALEQRSLVK